MSNLVEHARRELELIGEDEHTIEGYLKVVQAFADMGHSGGSAAIARPVLMKLLSYENLRPITDNPDEWQKIDPGLLMEPEKDTWQNLRNSALFSFDEGKHYFDVNISSFSNPYPEYESVDHTIVEMEPSA